MCITFYSSASTPVCVLWFPKFLQQPTKMAVRSHITPQMVIGYLLWFPKFLQHHVLNRNCMINRFQNMLHNKWPITIFIVACNLTSIFIGCCKNFGNCCLAYCVWNLLITWLSFNTWCCKNLGSHSKPCKKPQQRITHAHIIYSSNVVYSWIMPVNCKNKQTCVQ